MKLRKFAFEKLIQAADFVMPQPKPMPLALGVLLTGCQVLMTLIINQETTGIVRNIEIATDAAIKRLRERLDSIEAAQNSLGRSVELTCRDVRSLSDRVGLAPAFYDDTNARLADISKRLALLEQATNNLSKKTVDLTPASAPSQKG